MRGYAEKDRQFSELFFNVESRVLKHLEIHTSEFAGGQVINGK
jgi:hypothetical protein